MKNEFTGKGSLSVLTAILKAIKGKTVFIVRGKQSFEASGARERLKPLLKGHNVVEYSECRINPDIENVLNGVPRLKEAAPDVVIAFGGGSVIDTAKAINILAAQKEGSFEDMIMGKKKIFQKGLPFIAVPTTVGSGSEATHFATIYAKKKKYSISHEFIKPDFVILDPELCFSLPGKIIAEGAIDSLCHSIESSWSKGADDNSMRFAKDAINRILPNIRNAVEKRDRRSIEELSLAANFAGKAINISKTTAAHALSYPLTSFFGIVHGHAAGMILYRILKLHAKEYKKGGNLYLNRSMDFLYDCFPGEDISAKWKDLMETVGLSTDFRELGFIKEKHLDIIYENCSIERLNNNPVNIGKKEIKGIFEQ